MTTFITTEIEQRMALKQDKFGQLVIPILVTLAFNPGIMFSQSMLCGYLGVDEKEPTNLSEAIEEVRRKWNRILVEENQCIGIDEQKLESSCKIISNLAGYYDNSIFERRIRKMMRLYDDANGIPLYYDKDHTKSREFTLLRGEKQRVENYSIQVYTHPIHLIVLDITTSPDEKSIDSIPVQDLLIKYQLGLSIIHRFGDYCSLVISPRLFYNLILKCRNFAATLLSQNEYQAAGRSCSGESTRTG